MAEVLGVIASIIAVCQMVRAGTRRIGELYKAPKEVQKLLEQLRQFESIVRAVETTTRSSPQCSLSPTLSQARLVIVELNHLITVELLDQRAYSNRVRRSVWWKNRRKIVKLREKLKGVREALSEALPVHLVLLAHRIESDVTEIGQRLIRDHHTSDPTRLNVSTQSEQATASPISDATHESRSLFKATDCLPRQTKTSVEHTDDCSELGNASVTSFSARPLPKATFNEACNQRSFVRVVSPASSFETQASFRPEEYTVQHTVLELFGFYFQEVEEKSFIKVIECTVLYMEAPRKWRRLLARLTITVDSDCWNLSGSRQPVTKTTASLPVDVRAALKDFLTSQQSLKHDTCLNVFLGHRFGHGKESRPPTSLVTSSFQAKSYLQTATLTLRHLNCPWYFERQLIHRPLPGDRPANFFIAYFDSRWVREFRFGSQKSLIDADLYTLQVLCCLPRDAPGISPFIGLVLDDETGTVNAFLRELPAKGRICDVLTEENQSGNTASWERCERWCRQIIQGVAEVHSKGFVVGHLGDTPDCGVAIDSDDNAVLYRDFSTSFQYDRFIRPEVPPEFCQPSSSAGDCFTASAITDVYQLGLLLWRIVATKNQTTWNFCKIAGCCDYSSMTRGVCHEPHASPIQLPSPGKHTPQYLNDIIAVCRAENPSERLPAWQLLHMFPVVEKTVSGHPSPSPPRFPSQAILSSYEDCAKKYGEITACDRCRKLTTPNYFHCQVCNEGDFDLCPHCFLEKGLHCYNKNHVLLEYAEGKVQKFMAGGGGGGGSSSHSDL